MLDALGEGIAGALELVLGGLHLGQLFELVAFLGAQGLGASEIFQGLLRIQDLLVQGLGLGLAGSAVSGHGLLGLELLELFFQAFLLVAQRGTVGQGLQRGWLDMGQVDGQARHFETLAFEAVQDQLHGLDPVTVIVQRNAVFTQWQAEQCAVEQAHEAFDVLLRELFTQTGIAVVVGVIKLLLDRLQAFFQVAQTFFQVFGAELPGLGQGTGQFVVGVLGREQLLLQHLDVVHQGEPMLEHRQFAQPALDAGDFPLQAHQFLGTAALVILQ